MHINKFYTSCLLSFAILFNFYNIAQASSLNSQILQTKIYQKYKNGGIESAEAEYKQLTSNHNLTETDVIALLKIYEKNLEDSKYIELCKDGINKFPKSYTLYCLLGMKYSKIKKYDDAITAYTDSIRIQPTEPSYYNRGQIYYFIKKDYKNAIEDFSNAIKYIEQYEENTKKNKSLADIYKNRGLAYNQLNELDKSLKDFDTAISFEPENAEIYYNRAVIKISKASSKKMFKKTRSGLIQSANEDLNKASDIYQKNNNMIMYKKIEDYKKFEAVKSLIK